MKLTTEDKIKIINKGFNLESWEYKDYNLKPCPMCGSKNLKIFHASRNLYRVTCKVCHCRAKGFMCGSSDESKQKTMIKAVTSWNRRSIKNANEATSYKQNTM